MKQYKNHRQISKRKNLIILLTAVFGFIILLSAIFLRNSHQDEIVENLPLKDLDSPGKGSNKLVVDDVRSIINQYYSSLEEGTFNAHEFFNPEVGQYITIKNTSPHIINENYKKDKQEYTNPNFSIVNEQIKFLKNIDGIDYYTYSIYYKCYRPSKRKNQECIVDIEIGINNKGAFTTYRELKIRDLQFI